MKFPCSCNCVYMSIMNFSHAADDNCLSDCLIRHLSHCTEELVEEIHPTTIYHCLKEIGQQPLKWPEVSSND